MFNTSASDTPLYMAAKVEAPRTECALNTSVLTPASPSRSFIQLFTRDVRLHMSLKTIDVDHLGSVYAICNLEVDRALDAFNDPPCTLPIVDPTCQLLVSTTIQCPPL